MSQRRGPGTIRGRGWIVAVALVGLERTVDDVGSDEALLFRRGRVSGGVDDVRRLFVVVVVAPFGLRKW